MATSERYRNVEQNLMEKDIFDFPKYIDELKSYSKGDFAEDAVVSSLKYACDETEDCTNEDSLNYAEKALLACNKAKNLEYTCKQLHTYLKYTGALEKNDENEKAQSGRPYKAVSTKGKIGEEISSLKELKNKYSQKNKVDLHPGYTAGAALGIIAILLLFFFPPIAGLFTNDKVKEALEVIIIIIAAIMIIPTGFVGSIVVCVIGALVVSFLGSFLGILAKLFFASIFGFIAYYCVSEMKEIYGWQNLSMNDKKDVLKKSVEKSEKLNSTIDMLIKKLRLHADNMGIAPQDDAHSIMAKLQRRYRLVGVQETDSVYLDRMEVLDLIDYYENAKNQIESYAIK